MKTGINNVEVYEENGKYYLKITEITKIEDKYYERIFPKVDLGIYKYLTAITESQIIDIGLFNYTYKVSIGDNEFNLETGLINTKNGEIECLVLTKELDNKEDYMLDHSDCNKCIHKDVCKYFNKPKLCLETYFDSNELDKYKVDTNFDIIVKCKNFKTNETIKRSI